MKRTSKTNKLHSVTISKKDTCLSYVLKRTGLYNKVQACFVTELDREFDFVEYTAETLKRGDLVCWRQNEKEIDVPLTIDEGMTLMEEKVVIDFHLGVVESVEPLGKVQVIGYKVLISDCTRKVFDGVSSLRIREVGNSEGKVREPDFIVRLKEDDTAIKK